MNSETLSQPAISPAVATVLLVDDEPVSRLSMAARLKRMGLRVLEAGNGKEGLAILRRERPDLTILDWIMPEMDGPTVCEQVRQDPDILSSQLILMTSHDQPEQIAEGLARGADDFLSKAASKQEVLARVQSGLRAASLVRSIESTRDELRAKQGELEAELKSAAG
ncbi:MAG: response regulator, partial [Pseudohongiella sp.]|nr:response regulator [Pseudohongiella sp.]